MISARDVEAEAASSKSGAGVLPLVQKNRAAVLLRTLNDRVAGDLDMDGDELVAVQVVTKPNRRGALSFPNLYTRISNLISASRPCSGLQRLYL